jgi:hypothetical protein
MMIINLIENLIVYMSKNPDILEICPDSNKWLFGYYHNQRLNFMI